MDQDERLNNLMPIFLAELDERVYEANQLLLKLEKDPESSERPERIKSLFRTAHSIKGGAMAVGTKALEICCHSLEEIISLVQKGAELDKELILLLFDAIDAIEQTGLWIKASKPLDDSPAMQIVPLLKEAARELKESTGIIQDSKPVSKEATQSESSSINFKDTARTSGSDGLLKVSADKLDHLFASMTDLLATSGRWQTYTQSFDEICRETDQLRLKQNVSTIASDLDSLSAAMSREQLLLQRSVQDIITRVKQLRMVPFSLACTGLDRVMRDISLLSGKQCRLALSGGDIELDRGIIEDLKDPLIHLIRNAVDHGIENPSLRKANGKSLEGVVKISAALRGSEVEIKITDDGCGLNASRIADKATRQGLIRPESKAEILELIFQPGFSTSEIVTGVSGRGVGLDIVKNMIDRMHGSIDIDYEEGKGTQFSLLVPLTVITQRALLVKVNNQSFAFIATTVETLLRLSPEEIRTVEGKDVVLVGETPLPVVSLAQLIGINNNESKRTYEKIPAVVVRTGSTRIVFLVDELLTEREIVAKNLGARIRKTESFSGTAILPDGELALILNNIGLSQAALKSDQRNSLADSFKEVATEKRHRLILADDSVTTRSLEKSILESAGYEVIVAADGAQAWRLIQENNPDLVVSDVEMPNIDGFRLTEIIRSSQRFQELPVILVTALSSDRDKARGIEVGADAYLVKSEFDQSELLSVIKQLI